MINDINDIFQSYTMLLVGIFTGYRLTKKPLIALTKSYCIFTLMKYPLSVIFGYTQPPPHLSIINLPFVILMLTRLLSRIDIKLGSKI